jgi:DNA end-binding protein Ku
MTALKRSLASSSAKQPAKGKKPRKAAAGQKETLLPISGKRAAKAETKKAGKARGYTRSETCVKTLLADS